MELITVIMSGFKRILTPFPFSTLDGLQVIMSHLYHITLKHNKAIKLDSMVHTLCTCLPKNVCGCGCGCDSQTLYFTTFISHKIDNTCSKEPHTLGKFWMVQNTPTWRVGSPRPSSTCFPTTLQMVGGFANLEKQFAFNTERWKSGYHT